MAKGIKLSDLTQAIMDAPKSAELAGAVANFCRFNLGMNYKQTFELVKKRHPNLDEADWDQLLAEADDMEARA